METDRTILTLDQSAEAVRALSLAALEAAGRGTGKHAGVASMAYQAYKLAMNDGASEDDAIQAAQGALRAALKG